MKEICIIPTYKRGAFLYCCLEAIRKADPSIEVHVFPDQGTFMDSEVVEATHPFGVTLHNVPFHSYHGNSFNMIEALKWVYDNGYDRVFVVEDDCIVDETFFVWGRNVLDNPKPWMGEPFAGSGWEYSPDAPDEDGPDVLLNWYLSVCSVIPRRSLEHIVKHANTNYYNDMCSYLDKTFPRDPNKGSMHFEQDGLVLRVANSLGERVAWPRRPRAVHIGWHGYHRPHGKVTAGNLMKQVMVVKLALDNPDVMRQLMNGGSPPEVMGCRDCGKNLVSTNEKAVLVCAECFHLKHPNAPRTAKSHYYVKS